MATCAAFAGEDSPILEPLLFEISDHKVSNGEAGCPCVLCEELFNLPDETNAMLKHFVEVHKLVVSAVGTIANLNKYFSYWKKRFTESPLVEICSVIKTNSKASDLAPSEFYFVLCDSLPEDKAIRDKLQAERLELVLEIQQKERTDTSFSRTCLFCKQHFDGNRTSLFNHMAEYHHFNVGHPDNLVYSNELLDLLEEKLRSLKCLYCEKTFKDPLILREHMRKKRHKKLDGDNEAYHRFYIINYLEIGKNWKDIMLEDDTDSPQDAEEDTKDWVDSVEMKAICLFCNFCANNLDDLQHHMKSEHEFDLPELIKEKNLDYYHLIKLVNFIRRQIRQNSCTCCLEKFSGPEFLMEHMTTTGHISRIPACAIWDQPEFYFPTYENDDFLHMLPTDDNDEVSDGSVDMGSTPLRSPDGSLTTFPPVISEDTIKIDNELVKELLQLKSLILTDDT